jgi:hypothetical protein
MDINIVVINKLLLLIKWFKNDIDDISI